jgi:hypothetical protein
MWREFIDDALGDFVDNAWIYYFRVGLVEFTEIDWHDMIIYRGDDPLRHYSL